MTKQRKNGFTALLLTAAVILTNQVAAQTEPHTEPLDQAVNDANVLDEIFRVALTQSSAYEWLRDLCLDIGPRLSGSPQADSAVDYSFRLMQSMNLDPVKQALMVPVWQRGEKELAYFKSENGASAALNVCALGGSIATPEEGVFAPVIEVGDWTELEELGEENIRGKIVFFNEAMNPENLYTFHSYGHCVHHRWAGAVEAAKYGAVGALVRSLNLRIDEFPHTGSMKYDSDIDSIPAAAISTLHAEQLHSELAKGGTVKVFLRQRCFSLPDKESHNVFGEIKGSSHPEKIILVGGHLDSWDVGQGAHDDGAGVMQALGALEILQKIGYRPQHTIRVVFFMNEENGLRGAKAYAEFANSGKEIHIAAIESDRGGFTPRGFHVEGNAGQIEKIQRWETLLDQYGIHQVEEGGSGADIAPLKTDENVLIGFVPDSQRYFDHHHSAHDTFDTVNKRELELGTASIAALVYLIDKYGI